MKAVGLKAARTAIFGGTPWQRCQFHLQQNAIGYVPRQSLKAEIVADLRMIFNAPNRNTAEAYLAQMVEKYAKSASRLADWMEQNIPEGLTMFSFPVAGQRRLRTTNGLERPSRELRGWTRVAGIFPNEAACLRITSAILMEFHEEWQVDRTYLNFADEDGPTSLFVVSVVAEGMWTEEHCPHSLSLIIQFVRFLTNFIRSPDQFTGKRLHNLSR